MKKDITARAMLGIYGAILVFITLLMSSCSSQASKQRALEAAYPGLDRLMVEECGKFLIVPSKGMAVDTSIMAHPTKWKLAYYKLNEDSSRYLICK